MFRKNKSSSSNASHNPTLDGSACSGGGINQPLAMDPSVYQRNGIGYRPPQRGQAFASHATSGRRGPNDRRRSIPPMQPLRLGTRPAHLTQSTHNVHDRPVDRHHTASAYGSRSMGSNGPSPDPWAGAISKHVPTPDECQECLDSRRVHRDRPPSIPTASPINNPSGVRIVPPRDNTTGVDNANPPTQTRINNSPSGPPVDTNNEPRHRSGTLRGRINAINPFNKSSTKKEEKHRTMRIYIKSHMQPGQRIRVLCPNSTIQMATIPPRSNWIRDNASEMPSDPFFRVELDPIALRLSQDPIQSAQLNDSPCTCVPALGVFDTGCPLHGNANNNNNNDEDDLISIAHQEREEGEPRETNPGLTSLQRSVTESCIGWECKACSLINGLENEVCELCFVPRNGQRPNGVMHHEMLPATLHLK